MSRLGIGLIGASGRMGAEVIEAAARATHAGKAAEIVAGLVANDDPFLGKSLPGVKHSLDSAWKPEFTGVDVLIDFSSPAGTKKALEIARANKLPLLICTTGLGNDFDAEIKAVSSLVPVIRATNTSVGVNAALQLVAMASNLLGDGFEVEIVETHHNKKKDAPSGTALSLAESIANARKINLNDEAVCGREGLTGERSQSEIGIHALRGGDVVGEHTVYFFGQGERIEISHRARSRSIFADGAVRAATWLAATQRAGKSGLFTMADVLRG